jgi:single-strand DNA-binding protein
MLDATQEVEMSVVFVRGVVTRDPDIRTLADGATLASFDLTVDVEGSPRTSVPVALPLDAKHLDPPLAGDEVVVLGEVRRRFFRAGGSTQSRTEVMAEQLVPATDRRRVRRLLTSVSERLAE